MAAVSLTKLHSLSARASQRRVGHICYTQSPIVTSCTHLRCNTSAVASSLKINPLTTVTTRCRNVPPSQKVHPQKLVKLNCWSRQL